MSTHLICPSCHRRLIAPQAAAGLRVRCPGCQGVIDVPAEQHGTPAAAPIQVPVVTERWHVLAHDGKQYGPLSRAELDSWYAQGRVAPHSQLLREGDTTWQWATILYPALVPPQPATISRAIIAQRPPRSRPTETVSLVALLNYVICSLLVLAGVTIMIMGLRLGAQTDEAVSRSGARSTVNATTLGGMYGLCMSVFPLGAAVAYGAAGYGVMDRRHWGRVLSFVLAGISIVPAFAALFVFGFASFIALVRNEPMPAQLLITIGISGVLTVLFTGYTAYCFNILVRQKYAAEFR